MFFSLNLDSELFYGAIAPADPAEALFSVLSELGIRFINASGPSSMKGR